MNALNVSGCGMVRYSNGSSNNQLKTGQISMSRCRMSGFRVSRIHTVTVNALPGLLFCSDSDSALSGGDDVTPACESKNRFINSLFVSAFKWFGELATCICDCEIVVRLFNAAAEGDASAISCTSCCVVRTLFPTIFRIEAILWVSPSFASSFTRLALTLRRPEI